MTPRVTADVKEMLHTTDPTKDLGVSRHERFPGMLRPPQYNDCRFGGGKGYDPVVSMLNKCSE